VDIELHDGTGKTAVEIVREGEHPDYEPCGGKESK